MSDGAAKLRPPARAAAWRAWCLLAAIAVLLVALLPPLSGTAQRWEYAQTLQFSLLAIAVPALVAIGAPWRRLGLARVSSSNASPRFVDRVADHRRRHPELLRSLAFIGCGLAAAVAWHVPAAVAALAQHRWLAILEAGTLLIFGLGLWLELVGSPPLVPRSGYLRRAVLGAVVMWVFWILAYTAGLSNHNFYRYFHHAAGELSAGADQQIASAVLWFVAAIALAPVIFWNALQWLKTEEDPDIELRALTKAEQRRGTLPVTGSRGKAAPAS